MSILKWIGTICCGLAGILGVSLGLFGKVPKSMKVREIWLVATLVFLVLGLVIMYFAA